MRVLSSPVLLLCTAPAQVWDLLNGQNLHKLEPVSSSEVTGVTCLHGNQLLTVGWSRRVALYDIQGAEVSVVINSSQIKTC